MAETMRTEKEAAKAAEAERKREEKLAVNAEKEHLQAEKEAAKAAKAERKREEKVAANAKKEHLQAIKERVKAAKDGLSASETKLREAENALLQANQALSTAEDALVNAVQRLPQMEGSLVAAEQTKEKLSEQARWLRSQKPVLEAENLNMTIKIGQRKEEQKRRQAAQQKKQKEKFDDFGFLFRMLKFLETAFESTMMALLTISIFFEEIPEGRDTSGRVLLFGSSLVLSVASMSYGVYGMLPRTRSNAAGGAAPAGRFSVQSLQMFLCILVNLVWAFVAIGMWLGTMGFFHEVVELNIACAKYGCGDVTSPSPPPPLAHKLTGLCAYTCATGTGAGVCEDGLSPSPDLVADFNHTTGEALCPYGTDCGDCGWRPDYYAARPKPPPPPPSMSPPPMSPPHLPQATTLGRRLGHLDLPPPPPSLSPPPPLPPPSPPLPSPWPGSRSRPQRQLTTTFDFSNANSPGWSNGSGDPPYAFTKTDGSTPSSITGPSAGVGGLGSYLYAETSSRAQGDLFTLAYDGSACSNTGLGVSTVTFYYHMYGAGMGELRLTNAPGEAVWSLSGDKGNAWQAVTVDVYSPSFAFEYTRGSSFRGDAAVALVVVRCGAVSPPPPPSLPTTTFDFSGGITTGLGWSTRGGTNAFTKNEGGTPSSGTGPSAGVSGSGSYVFAETSGGFMGKLFTLAYDGSACSAIGQGVSAVAFYYHMWGATMGELRVTNATGDAVWSLSGNQGDSWQAATVGVYSPSFGFEYTRGSDYTGDAAVALVAVSCGAALPSTPPSPPPPPTSTPPSTPTNMAVLYGGYEYRTIMGNVPAAGNTELLCHGLTCRPLPDGYEIAPADSDVITNVIAAFTWSTHGEHAPVTSLLSLIAPHSVLPLWLRRSHGCFLELGRQQWLSRVPDGRNVEPRRRLGR